MSVTLFDCPAARCTFQPAFTPGYKIAIRTGRLWHTQYYLSEYPAVPAKDRIETLKWSPDSKRLSFKINGKLIWSYDVSKPWKK